MYDSMPIDYREEPYRGISDVAARIYDGDSYSDHRPETPRKEQLSKLRSSFSCCFSSRSCLRFDFAEPRGLVDIEEAQRIKHPVRTSGQRRRARSAAPRSRSENGSDRSSIRGRETPWPKFTGARTATEEPQLWAAVPIEARSSYAIVLCAKR